MKMSKLLVVGEWHIANCKWYDPHIIPDFNFTIEFKDGGEFKNTEELMKTLVKPTWKKAINDQRF